MWRFGVAVGFVLVLLLPAAAVSDARSHHAAPAKCPRGHTHLITADTQAQVYQVFSPEPSEILGCVYGGKHLYSVGVVPEISSRAGGESTHYTLAGVVLASEVFSFRTFPIPGLEEWHVDVENLRTGQVLHSVPTGTVPGANGGQTTVPVGDTPPNTVGVGPIVTLVVKSDGAVAWTVENRIPARHVPAIYEVHALDGSGARVLATGSDIDPHSLALAGSTLYWTRDGKPMSAPLD